MFLCEMESSCTPACFCDVFTEQLLNSWSEKERENECEVQVCVQYLYSSALSHRFGSLPWNNIMGPG